MAKTILIVCLCFFSGYAWAQHYAGQVQPSKVPIPSHHYMQEYTFDVPSDPARWTKQREGLSVSFASTDQLYMRSEVPALQKESLTWEGTGWRGERLNAQILLWSPDTVEQIRVTLSDLVSDKGKTISKDNLRVHLVRYVLSNYPYGSKKATCDVAANDTAYLMPDRFETFDRFDLPGKTVRPLWLSLEIPAATEAGSYTGSVTISSQKQNTVLNLKVRVQNQVLPDPHEWKYRLDLWQNPWVVAWYYQLEPWSDEHKALLKKHLALYADAGGKYITTYAVHSPWSDNSYMIEGAMIDWIKRKDGLWKFDYTIFDQYVQLAMDAGVDKAITIYTPVPWGHRFRYLDERSGNYVYEEWTPDSEAFKKFWNIFLDDLKAHLEKKGWFEKTYLGINENPLPVTIAAARVIKEHSKSWKITYAGDWHPELSSLLDDYSPVISSEPSQKELKERAAKGFTTTYYVCCTPPKPNNFVFSPPIEGRYISWYAAAYGYDGFLRWAYDAWPADPMRDARHTLWPAGDCFLVYPGGNSSIRYEKLREGIADYEKIRIVRELASKSPDKKIKEAWTVFENHLKAFVGDRDYSKRDYSTGKITAEVHKGIQMLETLSDNLSR
jgi:hypothetical protein